MEYSLSDIIALLKKRLVLITICTLLGLTIFFIKNYYLIKPLYTASVQLYVSSNERTSLTELNELNYAQRVITTYVYFLKTKAFYEQVLEECKLNYSADQLKAMTTIIAISNTEIFQISVTSPNSDDTYNLVKAMQKIAPDLIKGYKNTAEISVVDPVDFPVETGPNIKMNSIIGGLLGFLLSAVSIYLWEIFDVNVKGGVDLVKRYQIPVIGAIPIYRINKLNKLNILKFIPSVKKRLLQRNNLRGVNEEKKFEVNEAYNELRTNLRFTILGNNCKKIIISSPDPEDGKSTTSTNTAITIAQSGIRVLLIDCDLRKGKIHSLFNINNKPGISDLLSGMASEKDIIQDTRYNNLQVIATGSIPPNPTELLGSMQMKEALSKLEKNYDYIIIDSPPVNAVSDILSLVKLVDGLVIVVREGVTSHTNLTKALMKFKLVEANILGFVINGVDQNDNSKSHYYCKK